MSSSYDVLNDAIVFATEKHSGTFRKGTRLPYIVHPMEAAVIVSTMTNDVEVIAAAVLHDVLEDAGVTAEELRERFGNRVTELVAAESEDKREQQDKAATWRVRKEETIEHLRTCDDTAIKMIALGDKLSNVRSMYRDYLQLGDELWNRFNQKDKRQHEWYYRSICEAVEELSDSVAWKEYAALLNLLFNEDKQTAS